MKPKTQPLSKTRFVAYVATSIDGRISLEKRRLPDWTSKEDWKFFQSELAHADAVVVGRNMYLSAQSRLQKRTTFVLSSRVKNTLRKGTVTFVNPACQNLKKLFSVYKTVAIVGGARVYQTMLDSNLLHELYVTIEPLVFGRGVSMFSDGVKTNRFELVSVKKLNTKGTLLLHYNLKK
ncbi:MAG: dihydrofolate reductase [Candidatus Pacebacteria bacterium]|nr:dihydrofolate reductase [Candidatus Paceibacterota bacterium]MBP9832298.1 dihydrofolate reductase [Candidatus Paceibacterota bacterium]